MPYDYICNFDFEDCLKTLGVDERGRVQQAVVNEVKNLSESYVPFDLAGKYADPGRLIRSVHIENGTDIVWSTPYARRWYYEDANFQGKGQSASGGKGRGTYWVDRMMQNGGKRQIEEKIRKEVRE